MQYAAPIPYEQDHVQASSLPPLPTNGGAPQAFSAQPATFVQQCPAAPAQPEAEAFFVSTPPSPTFAHEVLHPMQPQFQPLPSQTTAPAACLQQMQYGTHLDYLQQAQYAAPAIGSYDQQTPGHRQVGNNGSMIELDTPVAVLQPAPAPQSQQYGQQAPQLVQAPYAQAMPGGQEHWPGAAVQVVHVWHPHPEEFSQEMSQVSMQPMMQWEVASPIYRIEDGFGAGRRPMPQWSQQHAPHHRGLAMGGPSPTKGSHLAGLRVPWQSGKRQDATDFAFLQSSNYERGGGCASGKGAKNGGFKWGADRYTQGGIYAQGGKRQGWYGNYGGAVTSWKGHSAPMKGKANGKAGFNGGYENASLPNNYEGQRCDLFVGRLADSATEANVRELFASVGLQIKSLKVPADMQDQPKGYAFVTLADPSRTGYALEMLNGRLVNGRPINVEPSAPSMGFKGDDGKGKGVENAWYPLGGASRGPPRFANGFGPGGPKGWNAEREWANGWTGKGKGRHQLIGNWFENEGGTKAVSNPNKLFVGNLTAEATTEDVWQALNPAGEIVGVRVLEGKFSGIAFVEYKDATSVERAVDGLQGVEIRGRPARLERQGGDGAGKPLSNASMGHDLQAAEDGTAGADQSAGVGIASKVQADDNHDIAAGASIARAKVVPPPSVAVLNAGNTSDADAAGGAAALVKPVEAAKPCKPELIVAEMSSRVSE